MIVPGSSNAAVLAIPPGITEIIAVCFNSNNFLQFFLPPPYSVQLGDIRNCKYLLLITFVSADGGGTHLELNSGYDILMRVFQLSLLYLLKQQI